MNPGKPNRMNAAQKQKQALAKKVKQAPSGSTSPKSPKGTESQYFDIDLEESEFFEEEYVNLTIFGPVPNA